MKGMKGRSGFGVSQFIMGLCLIVLGVFTFLSPRSIFTGVAVVYGVAAVITGICDIVIYIKEERFTGFGPVVSLISGIFSMMTGIALLAYPGIAEWIVALLFPLWFITHCISRLTHTALIRFIAGDFYYYFSLGPGAGLFDAAAPRADLCGGGLPHRFLPGGLRHRVHRDRLLGHGLAVVKALL